MTGAMLICMVPLPKKSFAISLPFVVGTNGMIIIAATELTETTMVVHY